MSPDRAMDAFANSAGYGTFIIGKSKFNVGRSNYGQKLAFMGSSVFREASSFRITTGMSVSLQNIYRHGAYPFCLPRAASAAEIEQVEKELSRAQEQKDKIAERLREQRVTEQELNARSKANHDAKVRYSHADTSISARSSY